MQVLIKPILLIVICFFAIACANDNERSTADQAADAVFFQGRIIYKYEFESTGLDADSLALLRAKRSEMLIGNGNYHFTFFGIDTTIYVYNGEEGYCYFRRPAWDGFRCMDYKVWDDTLKTITKLGEGEKILGMQSLQLKFEATYAKTVYNLSVDHKLDPEKYAKHASTHFNKVLKEGNGGIALKSTYEFPRFTVIETATEVTPMNIDPMLFLVPVSMVMIKCR
ncbi:MAG: hypothetical protein HKN22_05055 [Bacteroidia bacterium]|nr:hypothetical protein [Bacteroidia bacterium]